MKKYIIYFACLLAVLWGCDSKPKADDHAGHGHSTESHEGHDHDHDAGHQHAEGEECEHDHSHDAPDTNKQSHAEEIIFTPEQAKAVGLEVVKVEPGTFHQVIKTSGQILSAQGDEVTISATAGGIVSFNKTSLNEGVAVKSGESLVSISSRNIVDGDPSTRAKTTYDIAQREYQRAESLIGDKLISEKEYNEIKLSYENAKVAYQAIGQHTTAKGISVATPMTGFVKSKMVTEGQYVEVGQPLITVTQNRRLQLRADVSERNFKNLANIGSANFKTPYDDTVYSLSELNGRLVSFGKSAANQEYYIPVNFEFDNIGQLISGAYVEVYLLGQARNNVLSVPVTSLIEEQGIFFVYLKLDEEGYKKQEVKPGASDGNNVEILSGVKAGDIVVSTGAYHVKLASASSAIPHGHEH